MSRFLWFTVYIRPIIRPTISEAFRVVNDDRSFCQFRRTIWTLLLVVSLLLLQDFGTLFH